MIVRKIFFGFLHYCKKQIIENFGEISYMINRTDIKVRV